MTPESSTNNDFEPLELATAYASWVRGENKDQWVVYNGKGEVIGYLPSGIDEHVAMGSIRLGREFELKAFNKGITFGKQSAIRAQEQQNEHYSAQIKTLSEANERLAEQLHTFISGET